MENVTGGGGDVDYDRQAADPVPLASAPRHVRLEAAQHIESLVEKLTKRADALLTDVERAKRLAER